METNESLAVEEQEWLKNVYQGEKMPELTLKVFIVGTVIGLLLISSNIYLGLKTGLMEGGSVMAAIIAFALIKSFKGELSILENNNAQTMASAAGSMGIMLG